MSSSPGGDLKGKTRAPADPSDLESAPLLSPDLETSPSPSSPSTIRKSRFRNGRRDLDADDEEDTAGLLGSEDDGIIRVVPASPPPRNRLGCASICCLFFAFLFVLSLVVAAVFHLWIGHLISEQAKHGSPDEMAERGLLFVGPSSVKVSPIEDGNEQLRVMVEVEGMAGIDARKALGWEAKEDGKWLRRIENRVARWAVRKAHGVNVNVEKVELYRGIDVDSLEPIQPLVVVEGMDSLHLPLSYPTKADPLPKMQSFNLRIPVSFPSPRDLVDYGQAVWESKEYSIDAVIPQLAVSLDQKNFVGNTRMGGIQKRIVGLLPDLPATPKDPMSLVDLVSYSAFESPSPSHPNQTVIAMAVQALMKDPLADAVKHGRIPAIAWGMPFRLPVSISIPLPPPEDVQSTGGAPPQTEVTLARISTAPFSFPLGAKTAPIAVSGRVVPAGNLLKGGPWTGQPPLSRALSRFVARYLSGKPNDVLIRYDPSPEPPLPSDPSPDAPYPPSFVSDLASNYTFTFKLPGTNEVPDVFHNLRMEDMKIKLGGGGEGPEGDLLASGRVVGEVVLPEAAKALEDAINAKRIQPDVLVYDGDLPRFDLESDPDNFFNPEHDQLALGHHGKGEIDDQADYPPNPLPANAFARMKMVNSMPAETIHIPANSTHNATTIVSATFVDAPLFLLPGRSDVLRRFVGKIVFSGKAKASMKGISAVDLALGGFGEIGLQDIPIEASFMVGRSGVGSIENS